MELKVESDGRKTKDGAKGEENRLRSDFRGGEKA